MTTVICCNGMPAFELFLKERGFVDKPDRVVLGRASKADCEDAHVFALGNLPLHLAVKAARVTCFPLRDARSGEQLGVDALARQVGAPMSYTVTPAVE